MRQLEQNCKAASSESQTLSASQIITAFWSSERVQMACMKIKTHLMMMSVCFRGLLRIPKFYLLNGSMQTILSSIVGTFSVSHCPHLRRFDAEALSRQKFWHLFRSIDMALSLCEFILAPDALSHPERTQSSYFSSIGVTVVNWWYLYSRMHNAAIRFCSIRFFGWAATSCIAK